MPVSAHAAEEKIDPARIVTIPRGVDLSRFDPREVQVQCNCDHAGISRLLISLGREEVDSIIAEQGKVGVTCEFCGREYAFSALEATELFQAADAPPSGTRH